MSRKKNVSASKVEEKQEDSRPETGLVEVSRVPETQFDAMQEAKKRFLQALSLGYSVNSASKHAGISYARPFQWKQEDPDFAEAWESQAAPARRDFYVDIMRQRIVSGIQRPIYQGGKLVGHETVFDNNLLLRMVESLDPAFRQAKAHIEINPGSGGTMQLGHTRARLLAKLAGLVGDSFIEGKAE